MSIKQRNKVVVGWVVMADVEEFDKEGERIKVRKDVSRIFQTRDSAEQFLALYRKSSPWEAFVSAREKFETRKGAPEPAIV